MSETGITKLSGNPISLAHSRGVRRRGLRDVAGRLLAEVGRVGLAGELVSIAGEYAPATGSLEGHSEPADAAEQVNESQFAHGVLRTRHTATTRPLASGR